MFSLDDISLETVTLKVLIPVSFFMETLDIAVNNTVSLLIL